MSIITSVYNGDRFIEPFLRDITRQTAFDSCILYLVNADSPGNEEEICLDYQNKYPENISYFRLDDDPGIYSVWNMVVGLAETPYITNANLDDRLAPDCIEAHLNLLESDLTLDVAYCYNLVTFNANETFEDNSARRRFPTQDFSKEAMLRTNLPHNHPVWKTDLHDRFGLFDDTLGSAGDWEFWLRCSAGGAKFKLIPKDLGLYYFNPEGISTNVKNQSWKNQEEQRVRNTYT